MQRPLQQHSELVSDSRSTVFDSDGHSRFSVHASGTSFRGLYTSTGANSTGRSMEEDVRGNGARDSFDEAQIAQKLSGRMCFGVALPGTGHTAYVFDVRTSNGEQWKVSRRYSEFLDLDTKLRQMFGKPTRPFPPLPKKQIVGSQSEKVVEERQRMLALYLQAVLDNKILSSTSEVKRFIGMAEEEEMVEATPSVFASSIPRRSQH